MRKQILAAAVVTGCITTLTAVAAVAADDVSKEKTTVGGTAFIDFSSITQKNNDIKQANTGTGLDVKRFYLIVDHSFDETWSANLTTDFNYISADAETQVFIKKAFLQGKLSDALWGRAGSADLPWVPYVEGLYGYRYVEHVMIDRTGFGTSADWGLHAGGKLADGLFSYALSAVNGNGYKNPSRSKSIDVEGRISFVPVKGLNLAVGFYDGKRGQELETLTKPTRHASRFDALVAYSQPDTFRVGVEFFTAKNWGTAQILETAPEDKSDGYSVWGSFNFTPQLSVFARYDQEKPSKDLNSDLKDKYLNVGVAYEARKNVSLALVYKNEKLDNNSGTANAAFKTSDYTLTAPAGSESKYDEVGVFALVKF